MTEENEITPEQVIESLDKYATPVLKQLNTKFKKVKITNSQLILDNIENLSNRFFPNNEKLHKFVMLQDSDEKIMLEDMSYTDKGVPKREYCDENIPTSKAQEVGNDYIRKIIKKLSSNKNSEASRALSDFLEKNDLLIIINPHLDDDAGIRYSFPNNDNEKGLAILTVHSGYFDSNIPEDALAKTVGHELGHFLELSSRKGAIRGVRINARETETFADACGYTLANDAGYSLTTINEYEKRKTIARDFANKLFENPNESSVSNNGNPHPSNAYRNSIINAFEQINRIETKIPSNVSQIVYEFFLTNTTMHPVQKEYLTIYIQKRKELENSKQNKAQKSINNLKSHFAKPPMRETKQTKLTPEVIASLKYNNKSK